MARFLSVSGVRRCAKKSIERAFDATMRVQQRGGDLIVVALSRGAIRRAVLVSVIGSYSQGVFGAKRLHKVLYFAERESREKPFTFVKHWYGQWSEEVEDTLLQLAAVGAIFVTPLDSGRGNSFRATSGELVSTARRVVEKALPDFHRALQVMIRDRGYLPEDRLTALAYELPEFARADAGAELVAGNVPDKITIDVSEEDAEDIELDLNPTFVSSMGRVVSAIDSASFNLDRASSVRLG